jgi:hypothetical protein
VGCLPHTWSLVSSARDISEKLLIGAIDLHIHTAPDIYPRSVTAFEAAVDARHAGMKAIVIKSHSTDTSARAELVRSMSDFPVWGGVALNLPVGGLNPYAVLECARQGGRVIWMPTTSARNFLGQADNVPTLQEKSPMSSGGLVISENGELLPAVDEILRIVVDHDLVLASGHLSAVETGLLFERAVAFGVKRLVITHPHADFIAMPISQMRSLGRLGALNEMHYSFVTPAVSPPQSLGALAETIKAVGVEYCILATDGGQRINPKPVEMLRRFIEGLIELGFGQDELYYMTHDSPSRILGPD